MQFWKNNPGTDRNAGYSYKEEERTGEKRTKKGQAMRWETAGKHCSVKYLFIVCLIVKLSCQRANRFPLTHHVVVHGFAGQIFWSFLPPSF